VRALLDTHALIWAALKPQKLSTTARRLLEYPVSAVSFWEISLKHVAGKLDLIGIAPEDFPQTAREMGFEALGLDAETAARFNFLPREMVNRDPFDRMLAWQAICHDLTLVTRDREFHSKMSHGLKVVW
jgi:PIN domain nuclease of toxin-antitoxin system